MQEHVQVGGLHSVMSVSLWRFATGVHFANVYFQGGDHSAKVSTQLSMYSAKVFTI